MATSNQIAHHKAQLEENSRKQDRSQRDRQFSRTAAQEDRRLKETERYNKNKNATDYISSISKAVDSTGNAAGKIGALISAVNDPAWYNKNPELSKSVASIPFHAVRGRKIFFDYSTVSNSGVPTPIINDEVIGPTCMVYSIAPTCGIALDNTAAVNVAARKMLNDIQAKNSRTPTYTASDLMIYYLACDSAFSFYAWLTRLYALTSYYTADNVLNPQSLFTMNRVDGNDLVSRKMELYGYIATFAKKVNRLLIPTGYPIALRHMMLFSGIYKDDPSEGALNHMMVPNGFYKFGWDINSLGSLTFESLGIMGTKHTLDEIMDFGDSLIAPLFNDEDFGIMSSDIKKAYENDLYTVQVIPMDYEIKPIYDENILGQIMCLRTLPATFDGIYSSNAATDKANTQIYQYKPATVGPDYDYFLRFNPIKQLTTTSAAARSAWINVNQNFISLPADAKTEPEYIMEYTRLCAQPSITEWEDEISTRITIDSCGSELVTSIYLVGDAGVNSGAIGPFYTNTVIASATSPSTVFSNTLGAMQMAAFEHHPTIYWFVIPEDDTDSLRLVDMPFCNWDKIALLTKEDVRRMHDVALLSEFSI